MVVEFHNVEPWFFIKNNFLYLLKARSKNKQNYNLKKYSYAEIKFVS